LSTPQDEKLAGLVIRDRLLTTEQLEECRRIQVRLLGQRQTRSLAQVIVARHYASADQLRDLVAKEVARRTSSIPVPTVSEASDLEREDAELAHKLIARGTLTPERVTECLALTRRARLQRPDVRFAQVVLKKGYATREDLKAAIGGAGPNSGRYGIPATQVRKAFDPSSLGLAGPMFGPAPTTPPTSRARGSTVAGPSQPPSRAPAPAWSGSSPESASSQVSPLFGGQAAGPQPLFGEASGVVKPMFGYDASSASQGALPYRGSSGRLAPLPPAPMPTAPPPRAPWPAAGNAPGPPSAPPQRPGTARPSRPGPPAEPPRPAFPDPWTASQQPRPFPDARGNYKTVELDPLDPGRPEIARAAFPLGDDDLSESPTARHRAPVGGDPFGEGVVSSREFDAFASVRPPAQNFSPSEPIGLGRGSSALAELGDLLPPEDSAPGARPSPFGGPAPPAQPPPFGGNRAPPIRKSDLATKGELGTPQLLSEDLLVGPGAGSRFGQPSDADLPADQIGFGPGPGGFGPSPSAFGAPSPSAFGGPSPSAFGAPGPSAFGAPSPSAFGGPGPSAFAPPRAPAPDGDQDLPSDASTDAHDVVPDDEYDGKRAGPATNPDGSTSGSEGSAPKRKRRGLVLALLLLGLGGGGFAAFRIISGRLAAAEAERVFLLANRAPAKERDARKALALGEALGDSSKAKPDLRDALVALRSEVATLDAKDEAQRIVAGITDDKPAQDRFDAASKAIQKDTSCARAYLLRARARIALGRAKGGKALETARSAAASEDLANAVAMDPKLLEAYWDLANLQELNTSARDLVRAQLERVQEADREGYMGLLAQGRIRALDRDARAVGEALEIFGRAVAAKPDAPLPYLVRARFKLSVNRRDQTLADADKAVELTQAHSVEALVIRGWARRAIGNDLAGSRADCDAALAIDRTWYPAYAQRALTRFEDGDAKGAEQDASAAFAIDEGDAVTLYALAVVNALPRANASGFVTDPRKIAEARKHLRTAMEHDDRFLPAILLQGRLALLDHENETALRDFNRVIDLDPKNALALAERGHLHLGTKSYQEAQHDLDRAIELDAKNGHAFFDRGMVEYSPEVHSYEPAIADFTKALDLLGEDAETFFRRGFAFWKTGRLAEAVTDETAALQKGDKAFLKLHGYNVHYVRGMAHFDHMEWAPALEDFNETVNTAPANSQILPRVKGSIVICRQKLDEGKPPPEPQPPADDKPKPADDKPAPPAADDKPKPADDKPKPADDKPKPADDKPKPADDKPAPPADDKPK
jgi:tetratricopeptide (TPR) repeat protein